MCGLVLKRTTERGNICSAARQTYTRVIGSAKASTLSEKARKMAWEEILIAEGSDWCWWYGPEHASANRPEFDQLYRDHLANVYKLLEEPVPTELFVLFCRRSARFARASNQRHQTYHRWHGHFLFSSGWAPVVSKAPIGRDA